MNYFLKRIAYLLCVVIIVTLLVSLLVDFLPGDPARALLSEDATPEQIEAIRDRLDLDEPTVTRYFNWLGNAVQGDFGKSLRTEQPVIEAIKERLPTSLELVIVAQLMALLFAFPTAIYGAYRVNGFVDHTSRVASSLFISLPHFFIAIVAIELFAVKLGWLPATGFVHLSDDFPGNLKSIFLPALAIAAEPAGVYQRILRADMSTTLTENYVAFARSKGLSPGYVLRRHAVRPSTFSVTTVAGINTAKLIGGAIVVETIFALPGLGRLLIDAITARDMIMIQGVVFVITIGYVVINTIVDVLYGILDPRVRDAVR